MTFESTTIFLPDTDVAFLPTQLAKVQAERVRQRCASNPLRATLYDCGCIAATFNEQRVLD